MSLQRNLGALALVIMTTLPVVARAATPTLINHQGILTDGSGTPQVGTFTIGFAIYDVASGVTPPLWSESRSVTTDSQGRFTILLGALVPLPYTVFGGPDRWLGVTVSPDPEMSPRTRLVSVPYALRLATVDGAEGGTITSKVSIGTGHTNSGTSAFVAGQSNVVNGNFATIGGGYLNEVDSDSATCAGGRSNLVQGVAGVCGGGTHNFLTGAYSVVAGGVNNAVLSSQSAVGGGEANEASGILSTVGGGYLNQATGTGSVVPGGRNNVASGAYSVAMGYKATASHYNSFMWTDGTAASTSEDSSFNVFATRGTHALSNSSHPALRGFNYGTGNGLVAHSSLGVGLEASSSASSGASAAHFTNDAAGTGAATVRIDNTAATGIALSGSTNSLDATALFYNANSSGSVLKCFDAGFNNAFLVTSDGKVGIGNIYPAYPLHLASGAFCSPGGTWINGSDRAAKENFQDVDPETILEKVAKLPISEWNYKNEDSSIRHIGAMAQDFRAAFGLGEDDKHIATIDGDGIALAAIKALHAKTQEMDELKAQVAVLEQQVKRLLEKQGQGGR